MARREESDLKTNRGEELRDVQWMCAGLVCFQLLLGAQISLGWRRAFNEDLSVPAHQNHHGAANILGFNTNWLTRRVDNR